jgi:hypothetical protein
VTIKPVTTLAELNALDQDAILAGYLAGFSNEPNYTRREPGYWHGYMNGQVDGGYMPKSDEQAELARVYVSAQRAH